MNAPTVTGLCRRFGFGTAPALVAALAVAPTPVWAGATVSGSANAVTVEAQDSSIQDIFALLSRDFHIQYHAPGNLNGRLTGTYRGSLQQVVARVLDGHNFVVASTPAGITVTVFGDTRGAGGPNLAMSGPFAPPMSQNPRAWSPGIPRPGLRPVAPAVAPPRPNPRFMRRPLRSPSGPVASRFRSQMR